MSEEKPKDNVEKTESRKTSPLKFIALLSLGLFISLTATFSLIHFTDLRHKAKFDPVGAVIYKARSIAANTDVEKAHFHISETERIQKHLRKIHESGGNFDSNIDPYEKMIWHNDEATKYMLAAEKQGMDLNKEGLIKRLCDSLGEQYSLITGTDVEDIREEDKLYTRVSGGEDLSTVYEQIQAQLDFAMHW